MDGEKERAILFAAPNSYVLRNWVASGLADLVRAELGLDPVFASHFHDPDFSSITGRRYRNHYVPLGSVRGKETPIGYQAWYYAVVYVRLRLAAQERPFGGGQLLQLSRKHDALNYLLRIVRALFPRASRQRRWVRSLLEHINPDISFYVDLIRKENPAAVIVGTPGIVPLDQLMTSAARAAGVPVHCIVNSWDNLVSRGPMIRRPDTLMVWNQCMAEQAVHVHDFPAAATRIVGSLQFSRYADAVTREEHDALYRRIGLPTGTRFLLYLTSAEVPEYEVEDIVELLRQLDSTEFRGMPFVIRVHPQADSGLFASIADPRVHLDRSPQFANKGSGGMDFGEREMRSMAALLTQAAVVFASAGTTALLEAAIFDRPIVQLRWMDALPRSRPLQAARVRDYQRYLHIRDLDATECRQFCDSPASLAEDLGNMKREAREFAIRRRRAVERLVTIPVGAAPRRVTEALREALGTPARTRMRAGSPGAVARVAGDRRSILAP